MSTFQFDQCFNDKKIIKACSDEGLASARRLPRDLWGKSDPDLLAVLMQSSNPFVTLDRALPMEHVEHIPSSNPGIVVASYSRDNPRTITTTEAGRILRKFKERVKTWDRLPVQNSILEITEKSVEIRHVENRELVIDGYFEFAGHTDWTDQLAQLLQQNAARTTVPSENPNPPPPSQTDA